MRFRPFQKQEHFHSVQPRLSFLFLIAKLVSKGGQRICKVALSGLCVIPNSKMHSFSSWLQWPYTIQIPQIKIHLGWIAAEYKWGRSGRDFCFNEDKNLSPHLTWNASFDAACQPALPSRIPGLKLWSFSAVRSGPWQQMMASLPHPQTFKPSSVCPKQSRLGSRKVTLNK